MQVITVDDNLKSVYEKYLVAEKERLAKEKKGLFMPDKRPDEQSLTPAMVNEQVGKSDMALITIGRTSGEFLDRNVADFNLSQAETQMVQNVTSCIPCCRKEGDCCIEYRWCY